MIAPSKLLDRDDDIFLLEKLGSTESAKKFKEEGDFLYGHVTGASLEEFVVTKFNRKGKA